MKIRTCILPLLAIILITSCKQKAPVITDWDAFMKEHEEWQENRVTRLKAETGWLNLAGLFWLKEGENSFGSDTSNTIVFPEGFPASGGRIILADSTIRLVADPGTEIIVANEPVTEMILRHDQEKNTTVMENGRFRWFIIKRGDRYGIRLRDLEHPRIAQLDHIPSYPFSKEWVVEATLVKFDSARTIEVPTVIPGFSEFYKAPGELQFTIHGKKQSLIPFKSGNGYFLIVGDETNGMETYGAGRFLYTNMVNGDKVIIDFNKAYNPPCAFSPFATCPLPPLENNLEIRIEAGEKAVHME